MAIQAPLEQTLPLQYPFCEEKLCNYNLRPVTVDSATAT